jgi:predicted phage terminase large subunit-like protein
VVALASELWPHHYDVRAQLARDNLIVFTKRMFPAYRPAAHHWAIANALEAVERGETLFLAITMPPRHGKSELASVHFPAWFLGRNPDKRIVATSYSAALAYRFSRRARNLFSEADWPFDVMTAGDLASVQAWDIAGHRGGYVAAGVGGSITGVGADVLAVDDPVKSAEEADSDAFRERAWEWFTQTALTRLEPGGRVVLIGTRWHEDDLIGRALQMSGTDWVHLDLPALAEDGTALWPERYPAEQLAAIRERIGARAFNALYQQRPAPAEGAILKREWWRHYRPGELPDVQWTLQCWDTAFKTGQENDWSVCATWAMTKNGYYLLDRWRGKVEFPALKRAVIDQYGKHHPDEILVEDAASGQSLIQSLNDETRLPIIGFKPDRDKVARVNAISPAVEAGKVYLPAEAGWLDEFVEEHAAFPTGAHDDQVDTTAMALGRLMDNPPTEVDPGLLAGFVGVPAWGWAE